MMSLIKNELEWVKVFAGQLSLSLITPGSLPVFKTYKILLDDLEMNWSFPFNYCQKKDILCTFTQTLGIQEKFLRQPDCKSVFYPYLI